MNHPDRRSRLQIADGAPFSGRRRLPVLTMAILTTSLLLAPMGHANSLPFRALDDDSGRFTASALTEPYELDLNQLLDYAEQSSVDLDVLDRHGWFPMDDVPYDPNTHDMFQWAEENMPTDPQTPEEQVAGESGTAGVNVGIPSAVAVGGAVLGGLGLLASILAGFF